MILYNIAIAYWSYRVHITLAGLYEICCVFIRHSSYLKVKVYGVGLDMHRV